MAGSLYRTGPGSYKVPVTGKTKPAREEFKISHWFDGFTTIHRFDLIAGEGGRCGEVHYSSRSQTDELIEHARKTGRLDCITFGQKRDPCDSLYKKVKTVFEPHITGGPHTRNVGVVFRDILPSEAKTLTIEQRSERKLLTVTTDNNSAKHFDADTLEPLGVTEQRHVHPELTGPLSAAHAEHDPVTGDVFNYNLDFGPRGPIYRIFRASPATGETEVLAKISGNDIQGAYIHSFFLTENFVILCVWNAHYRLKGVSLLWERNILDSIAPFNSKNDVVWLVVDRRHGRGLVKKLTSPAFFSFHSINAWEQAGTGDAGSVDIMCELFEFDNMDILHKMYYRNLVSNEAGALAKNPAAGKRTASGLVRYKLAGIPTTTTRRSSQSTASDSRSPRAERVLDIRSPAAGDLPRINPTLATKPHRYVWSTVNRGRSSFIDGLVKTDTFEKTCVHWDCDKHTPGEPIFIPAPDAESEDDGVLLCVVLNGETETSYLLCLDARTMQEVGRAEVGRAVGFGFHGRFVPT